MRARCPNLAAGDPAHTRGRDTPATAGHRALRRCAAPRRLIAATLALSMLLLDQTIVSVALPAMQRSLGLDNVRLQWVVNGYLLALAVLVAPGGRIVDLLDWRRSIMAGAALFGAASLLCGLAPDADVLLAGRALQGVGAALMMPAAYASIPDVFPAAAHGRMLGTMSGIGTVCLSLGPLVGGAFTQLLDWRLIFFVNPPLCLVAIVILRRLQVRPAANPHRHADLRGAALLVAGLSAIVVALMQLRTWGATSPTTLGVAAAGVALLVLFVLAENRSRDPLLPPRLFRAPAFTGTVILVAVWSFAVLGVTVFAMLYVQLALGYGPIAAGVLMLPTVILSPPLSPLAGRWADRIGPRPLMLGGMAILTLGLAGMAGFAHLARYALMLPVFLLFGAGRVLGLTPANKLALDAVPPDEHGIASGVLLACREMGSTLGIAVLGSILVAVEDRRLTAHLAHVGLGTRGIEKSSLDGLLAGSARAQHALAALPPNLAQDLRLESASILADAFGVAMGAAALIALAALLFAFATTRPRPEAHLATSPELPPAD